MNNANKLILAAIFLAAASILAVFSLAKISENKTLQAKPPEALIATKQETAENALPAESASNQSANTADSAKTSDKPLELILYYGATCPHCKIVEDYLYQNKIQNIAQKEVYQNYENQDEMVKKARACGLDLNNLGVPLLWDGKNSKCYVGDQPIIDYIKQKYAL